MATNTEALTDTYINDLIQKKIQARNNIPQIQAAQARSELANISGSNPIAIAMSGLNAFGQGLTGAETRAAEQALLNQKAQQQNFANQQSYDNDLINLGFKKQAADDKASTNASIRAKNNLLSQEATLRREKEKNLNAQKNALINFEDEIRGLELTRRKDTQNAFTSAEELLGEGQNLIVNPSGSGWVVTNADGSEAEVDEVMNKALSNLNTLEKSTLNQDDLRNKTDAFVAQFNNNNIDYDNISSTKLYEQISSATAEGGKLNPTQQRVLQNQIQEIDFARDKGIRGIYGKYGIQDGSVEGQMLNDDTWSQDAELPENYLLEQARANPALEDPDDTYDELYSKGGLVSQIKNDKDVKAYLDSGELSETQLEKVMGQIVRTAPVTAGYWFTDSDLKDNEFIKQVKNFLPSVVNQNRARKEIIGLTSAAEQSKRTQEARTKIIGY